MSTPDALISIEVAFSPEEATKLREIWGHEVEKVIDTPLNLKLITEIMRMINMLGSTVRGQCTTLMQAETPEAAHREEFVLSVTLEDQLIQRRLREMDPSELNESRDRIRESLLNTTFTKEDIDRFRLCAFVDFCSENNVHLLDRQVPECVKYEFYNEKAPFERILPRLKTINETVCEYAFYSTSPTAKVGPSVMSRFLENYGLLPKKVLEKTFLQNIMGNVLFVTPFSESEILTYVRAQKDEILQAAKYPWNRIGEEWVSQENMHRSIDTRVPDNVIPLFLREIKIRIQDANLDPVHQAREVHALWAEALQAAIQKQKFHPKPQKINVQEMTEVQLLSFAQENDTHLDNTHTTAVLSGLRGRKNTILTPRQLIAAIIVERTKLERVHMKTFPGGQASKRHGRSPEEDFGHTTERREEEGLSGYEET